MRRLVLVLGAGGQLGEAVAAQFGAWHEVVAYTRADVDVTNASAVRACVADVCPDAIINCSAYTDVDGAERHPVVAFAINAWPVRTLARAASDIGATFIHYSTDFVFDGRGSRPYVEDDAPNPLSAYAMSKLLGEWLAAECPRHYILRVESLFGGPRAKSSVDRILAGITSGVEVRAFVDRTVSPSFVDDVVMATQQLLSGNRPHGLYHCVNSGHTTWVELAHRVAELAGRPDAPIAGIKAADLKLLAARPLYAALSNDKLRSVGVSMPSWQDALARYVTSVPSTTSGV